MSNYENISEKLRVEPQRWLVTGVAGFIGSNLLETLLKLDQHVIGLDNFATGHFHNLTEVRDLVSERQWRKFEFIEGDRETALDSPDKIVLSEKTAQKLFFIYICC